MTARPPQPSRRQFAWVAVAGARFYDFQLFRAKRKIFEAWPTRARVALPSQWVYRGHTVRLRPGRYRWIVRPARGSRSRGRYGNQIVRAKLVVTS